MDCLLIDPGTLGEKEQEEGLEGGRLSFDGFSIEHLEIGRIFCLLTYVSLDKKKFNTFCLSGIPEIRAFIVVTCQHNSGMLWEQQREAHTLHI